VVSSNDADQNEAGGPVIVFTPYQPSEAPMPYPANDDLPPSVRRHLPPHAQDIYRQAFNHAFAAHAGDARQEEAAHRIAWGAVKHSYVKVGDSWIARSGGG
jgi:cation transport regulator